jgi:predicted O-methyltransferase YrrM
MDIVNPVIEQYIDHIHGESGSPLSQMEQRAAREGFPIIGPAVGRLLALLTASTGARHILELGSGFGYSAVWFARGLQSAATEDGPVVICTDSDPVHAREAAGYFEEAGVSDLVRFHTGDALSFARELSRAPADRAARLATGAGCPAGFDIVFNDVDKEDYPEVPEIVLGLLRPGGLLITDNTLWYGTVTDPGREDAATRGVAEYNRIVTSHPRLESVIIPVRDGVTISRKTTGGT